MDDLLGKAELRDAVHQHAAGAVERLEDGDVVAVLAKLAGGGEPGGTGADDGDFFPGIRAGFNAGEALAVPLVVCGEALEIADGHGSELLRQHAAFLALGLLRADASAHRRKRVGLLDDFDRLEKILFDDRLDEGRDVDAYGTSVDAGRLLALEAALGFQDRLVVAQPEGDLVEVMDAVLGRLLIHFLSGYSICHGRSPRQVCMYGRVPSKFFPHPGTSRAWS